VDVRVSDAIFTQLSEAYRKIRNTARIILANLGDNGSDFNPDTDMVDIDEMENIDKWALCRLNRLVSLCRAAYDRYEFHVVYHEINNFCTTDMSKLYIDITKDRVYVEKKDGRKRRSAQSAMYLILSALTRLLAPILAFTTEEIWLFMPHTAQDRVESVLLNPMPEVLEKAARYSELEARYNAMFDLRDGVMKALEIARADKLIGKSLEAKVTVWTEDAEKHRLLESFASELATLFIVSKAVLVKGRAPEDAIKDESSLAVKVELAQGRKCCRCWMQSEEGITLEDSFVCDRCRGILGI